MKIAPLFCVGVGLFVASRLEAQTSHDSTSVMYSLDSSEAELARQILDDPGTTDLDPNEAFEYLDGLHDIAATGLKLLHANPDMTWTDAHAAVRAQNASTGVSSASAVALIAEQAGKFSLRSRESEPLEATSQQGYLSGAYLGQPVGYYNQIRAASPALEVSAIEEKQSWEPSFTQHLGGFVMIRRPIAVTSSFRVEQAIGGDYGLAFGNGLLFGGGFGRASARSGASAVEQRSFGMRGTLLGSSKSLRGGVMEFAAGPTRLFVFASDRAVDANVVSDTIRTIYSGGTYRTQSELELASAATIRVMGARAEMATPDTARLYLKGGVTGYRLQYDHPYVGTSSQPFLGTQLGMAGCDVLAIGEKWSASGEAAISADDTLHRSALILTSVFAPAHGFAFSLLYSHIPDGFNSPFGQVSGVGASGIANLDGYYIGIEFAPIVNKLSLNAYASLQSEIIPMGDLFGKQKHDYLMAAHYQVSKGFDLHATIRDEQDATVKSDSSRTGYVTVQGEMMNVRLEASYRSISGATFRTSFDQVRYVLTNTQGGWSATEQMRVPAPAIRSELMISMVRFETVSSNAAMWIYESGAPGVAAINTLDGLGWRLAFTATVHALRALACSLNLAGTVYDVPRIVGSGLSARTGTTDFNAVLQLDLRL